MELKRLLILNRIVWNFYQNGLIRREMTPKVLICRKTKQPTNKSLFFFGGGVVVFFFFFLKETQVYLVAGGVWGLSFFLFFLLVFVCLYSSNSYLLVRKPLCLFTFTKPDLTLNRNAFFFSFIYLYFTENRTCPTSKWSAIQNPQERSLQQAPTSSHVYLSSSVMFLT